MMISNQSAMIEQAIDCHFATSPIPGEIHPVDLEGLQGCLASHPHPSLSMIRWTTTDREIAKRSLKDVIDRIRVRGGGFEWILSPRCEASGLLNLLEQHQFVMRCKIAVMSRPLRNLPTLSVRDVDTWEIEEPLDPLPAQIIAEGFDVPAEVAMIFHQMYCRPSPVQRTRVFVAGEKGSLVSESVGYLSYIAPEDSALLRVSCTRPASRGRGLYKSLIMRRMLEATADGRKKLFVLGYTQISQTCLSNLGFERLGDLRLYRWENEPRTK